ncbi:MAG: hypothetical protein JO257_27770 [Deltaproteobacteria bacterium]|nr:hypothetical protein [Deltaproteobacteria bacterium]
MRRLAMAGCLLGLAAPASAFVPKQGARINGTALTAVGAQKPLREVRRVDYMIKPSPAWARLAASGKWQAAWDAATGVAARIWGSGIAAPGSVADPAIAEQVARQVLADNLALLAPGASLADFVLLSNTYDGNIRAVGFAQMSGGVRVLGGQVSFEFKNDRLFVMGSEALPNVMIDDAAAPRLARGKLADRAGALKNAVGLASATVSAPGEEAILPLVADDGVIGYRLVRPMTVEGGADGRFEGYVDVHTGEVIAVRSLNLYAAGTVLFHGVNRYPGRGYLDYPAPRAHVTIGATPETTSQGGNVTWSPDGTVALAVQPDGDLVTIVNKAAMGVMAMASLSIAPNGSAVWDASAVKEDDSQLNTYINVNTAKEWVRANVDAQMPTLDDQITANVNIAQDCNAFFDGTNVNFFHASAMCENTGEIQDVVFHEYGHRVHTAEIIQGVGAFDGAMSEGVADFLAASITNDSGMGRGFFFNDTPLRELDPPDSEAQWPRDIGEIHKTGMIFGGTWWDLRKALIAQYGMTEGVALTEKLWLGALRRSVDIPSSLIETLAADDDDGDLSNGTPHECLIRDAYGRHGLRTVAGIIDAPGTLETNTLAVGIIINVTGLSNRCGSDSVTSARIDWKPAFGGTPIASGTTAQPAGNDRFFVELPLAPQNTVLYKVTVGFADGSSFVLADNRADPLYELYQGRTVPLYCTDFETDPFAAGWKSSGGTSGFQWGAPTAGATDPHEPYSGTRIMAQVLDGDYLPKSDSWVETPEIDVGRYTDVRLQYRRWLAVEDSHFDQAQILANGTQAWLNFTDNMGDNSATQHVDKEWRFQDVALTPYFTGHKLKVRWELKADPGLQFGGWQMDDVCIVANPNSICGDGVKSPTEQCDNGSANNDLPNLCRSDCRLPTCGDSIIDDGEQCDDGSAGSPDCSKTCKQLTPPGGGCCSTGGGQGSILLTVGAGALLLRRRRQSGR